MGGRWAHDSDADYARLHLLSVRRCTSASNALLHLRNWPDSGPCAQSSRFCFLFLCTFFAIFVAGGIDEWSYCNLVCAIHVLASNKRVISLSQEELHREARPISIESNNSLLQYYLQIRNFIYLCTNV